jgi:ribosomal 30S subunit maturation factor RimM
MTTEERRTVIDFLEGDYETWLAEAKRLREDADELTVKADRQRRKADAIELQAVEARAAATLLRNTGFRIDRDPDGLPRVHVDQSEPSR